MTIIQKKLHPHFTEAIFPSDAKFRLFETGDLPFNCSRLSQQDGNSVLRSDQSHLLVLPMKSHGRLELDIAGIKATCDTSSLPLTFAPRGAQQLYNFKGETDNLLISLDAALVDRASAEWGKQNTAGLLDPMVNARMPRVEHLMRDMQRLMNSADAGWRIMTEAAALQITAALFRHFAGTGKAHAQNANREIDFQRLEEFVEAYLDENITLTALAVTQDMDVFAFSRAFKAQTGKSPGQFLIERRIERACRLLTTTHETLADIAYACGFSSQAHMTSTFTKHLGISPGRYRVEVNG